MVGSTAGGAETHMYRWRVKPGTSVILYELNEVPWEVLDAYCAAQPTSNLAQMLPHSSCLTTLNEDPLDDLQPWRTWPTFHTGLYTADHNSYELGQDPATFRGEPIWTVAERCGLTIGLFGVLQSWPAHEPAAGGFYVPDTFARTPETYPAGLSRFQAFNLAMTAENTFSASARLGVGRMMTTGLDLFARGLTAQSAARIVRILARERRDARWRGARPMAQVVPAFDLYWRLHRRTRPDLSIFFTNHVASMMHRYWGDAMADYASEHAYSPDAVFGRFLFEALDVFDQHLGTILSSIEHADARLIVASSMGQNAVPFDDRTRWYVLQNPERLARELALGPCEAGLAMYPRYSLAFSTPAEAERASRLLETVRIGEETMFSAVRVEGRSVSAEIARWTEDQHVVVDARPVTLERIGVVVEERIGGGNTAYHVPQGVWIEYGRGVKSDFSRAEFSVLEAKPRILELLDAS
jgi:hypothetical protein